MRSKTFITGKPYLPLFFIVILLAMVYYPAMSLYLMGDDFAVLNSAYQAWKSPLSVFDPINHFFRPFIKIALLLNYTCFHTDVVYYLITTLSIHIMNVCLLYVFLLRVSQRSVFAVMVALFFGTSPLYIEVPLWASIRSDSLVLFFGLSFLLLVVKFPNGRKWWYHCCSGFLLVGAACSKENWVILPFLAIGSLVIIQKQSFLQAIRCHWIGLFLLAGYGMMFLLLPVLQHTRPITGYAAPLTIRAMLAKVVFLLYQYAWLDDFFTNVLWQQMLSFCLFIAFLGILALLRNSIALWGGMWMVLAFAPTVAIQYAPSRYNYLPLVGFWIMVVAWLEHLYFLIITRISWVRRYLLMGVSVLCLWVVSYQCILTRGEIEDYRVHTDAHATLVAMYARVKNSVPEDYPVIVINRGTWRPIRNALQMVQGYPKVLFVRETALWELIYFDHLANFVNNPFETLLAPIQAEHVLEILHQPSTTILFTDQGFTVTKENIYQQELIQLYHLHHRLPDNVRIYQFTKNF